ncbi:hypothetical protein [Pedobacter sp. BMA]|uniref:hypothetical protein n=1 Tax=Pedobacter sp. BMA TaxID=1663685 RepID=UPI0012E0BAE5|nr:hypothetical protein [Pedobacter sp. BMA]
MWANEINKLLKGVSPVAVIGVLSSVFSITAANYAKKLNLSFIVFIHDNWLNSVEKDKKPIKKYATRVLNSAEKILPVTADLVSYFDTSFLKKTQVLLPVPCGHAGKALWREEMKLSVNCLHVGTVNYHTPYIFDHLLNNVFDDSDQLSVIYYDHPILNPFLNYNNFKRIDFFDTSSMALDYAVNNCSALVLYYGLTLEENPYAIDSFPSRFVEFVHTGLPIICIAPQESSFYKFMQKKEWPLLFTQSDLPDLAESLKLLKLNYFWRYYSNLTIALSQNEFNPEKIHNSFLKSLTRPDAYAEAENPLQII